MEYTEFSEVFHTVMADNGLPDLVDETKSGKFYTLMRRLLEVNQVMNLTAIREEKAVILRHFADSLTVAAFLPQNARVADIGCGAGFPCLPLALVRSDLALTAIDSTEKRVRYVRETAELLEIPRFEAVSLRAEEAVSLKNPDAARYRERFDAVTARAVAALPALSELCLPYVKVGGVFLAMKAERAEEERAAAERAIKRLGGEVVAAHPITLRMDGETDTRVIFEIRKVKPTPPDLPRPWAKITKSPL